MTVNASSVSPPVVQPAAGGVIVSGGGNTLLDSTGVVSANLTSVVGSSSFGATTNITASGGPTVIQNTVASFQLGRAGNVLVLVRANAGSNCAAGLFNLLSLGGETSLTVLSGQGVYDYAILQGVGAGTINYQAASLFSILSGPAGMHQVWLQVPATTNGFVAVNNGTIDVFLLGT